MRDFKFYSFIILICGILLLGSSQCWWNTGHMAVANIAKLDLLQRNPDVYEFMNNLTAILEDERHGRIKNLVESSTWPDLVKEFGQKIMDPWHYRDIALNYSDPNPPKVDQSMQNNALEFIGSGYKQLITWKKEETKVLSEQYEKSFTLSYLIHIVGDIHQPLHSCALFNEEFKKGDQGGNYFTIKFKNSTNIKNLHALWDSVINRVTNDFKMPLNKDDEATLNHMSTDLMTKYSRDSLPELLKGFKFADWLLESWAVCRDYVYKNITKDQEVSSEYAEGAFEIAERRIAIAGYRVADLLEASYKAYQKAISPQENKSNFLEISRLRETK